MQKPFPRSGCPWTGHEEKVATAMYRRQESWENISMVLGRTVGSIKDKLGDLKVIERLPVGRRALEKIAMYKGSMPFDDHVQHSAAIDAIARERACRLHLVDLLREMGCTTLGEAKATYRHRHEYDVPPGPADRVMVTWFQGSGVGSQAAWCAEA